METSALICYGEEMSGSVSAALSFSNLKSPLVCPKPKRVAGLFNNHRHLSLRWCKRSFDCEQMESEARTELLDLILNKEDQGEREVECSPPFFSGSPPSRVSNPIVQDINFGNEKISPLSTLQFLSSSPTSGSAMSSPTASPSHKGGCASARMKFGLKPAAVRVEGFECRGLGRDHKNTGVTVVA